MRLRVFLTSRSVAAAVPRSKEPARRNFAQQGNIAGGPDVWTEPLEWLANVPSMGVVGESDPP